MAEWRIATKTIPVYKYVLKSYTTKNYIMLKIIYSCMILSLFCFVSFLREGGRLGYF